MVHQWVVAPWESAGRERRGPGGASGRSPPIHASERSAVHRLTSIPPARARPSLACVLACVNAPQNPVHASTSKRDFQEELRQLDARHPGLDGSPELDEALGIVSSPSR